ncbi:MAG: hypothetical protein V3T58_01225, partial [Candidatus Hydrothermarchaeales archaeon]
MEQSIRPKIIIGVSALLVGGVLLRRLSGKRENLVTAGKRASRLTGEEFSKFGITADMFVEGHWWGMEVEGLTPFAKQVLKIPSSVNGLWVDETNLWAVRCDIKSADI